MSAGLRVLMLSDVYFPRVNGVSTSIRTTRRHLSALGVESALLAPGYDQAPPAEDVRVRRVPGRRLPFDPEDRLLRWGKALRSGRQMAAEGFDLIHVHTPFVAHRLGVRLRREFGLPLVETFHTHFEAYVGPYLRYLPAAPMRALARRFSRHLADSADAIVVPSRAMGEVLQGYGVSRPMWRIPTGIETAEFEAGDGPALRARLGIDPRRPLLLHVGRVAREKNIDFLLHVMARVKRHRPDALLLIAGDGPARSELEGLARWLALDHQVRFVGYLDRRGSLQSCYRAADLFVFASRTETQGLVLLEAMACGLPVVSTAVMGTRDLLEQGLGAEVAREDVDDFAEAVVALLDDPERRARLSIEARRLAARQGADTQAQRLRESYLALLERSAIDRAA